MPNRAASQKVIAALEAAKTARAVITKMNPVEMTVLTSVLETRLQSNVSYSPVNA